MGGTQIETKTERARVKERQRQLKMGEKYRVKGKRGEKTKVRE